MKCNGCSWWHDLNSVGLTDWWHVTIEQEDIWVRADLISWGLVSARILRVLGIYLVWRVLFSSENIHMYPPPRRPTCLQDKKHRRADKALEGDEDDLDALLQKFALEVGSVSRGGVQASYAWLRWGIVAGRPVRSQQEWHGLLMCCCGGLQAAGAGVAALNVTGVAAFVPLSCAGIESECLACN
jgi:hypothetical protein